jgi:hypothetical protein
MDNELSKSFTIDPDAPWVQRHNKETDEVLNAYHADAPIRVPLLCGEWYGQHGFYADEEGIDYRSYYTNPNEMVRVQLEAARRRRELPIYDFELGKLPERWPVSVDQWPVVVAGWLGCEVVYRHDSVVAHHGLKLSKEACQELQMPDPLNGGLLETIRRFWDEMREQYEGKLTFLGRPVGPFDHGVGIYGFFSVALDLRGPQLMSDMYDDPEVRT